ncbi:hypothetical protein FSARC_14630 [Fusarium sarcochroum]|uniref:ABC toxin N-terminal domain-containing protein n=1 Tax=Fusarium sarcochroum TaxID=1208366 RepID=A0A8H4WP00_9HYPO|nr:hypothetical protein FSARC_14630 [Fusarium sarcochroum]
MFISTVSRFGIDQQAIFIKKPHSNVLWDCLALPDDETVYRIEDLGGNVYSCRRPLSDDYIENCFAWALTFNVTMVFAVIRSGGIEPSSMIEPFHDLGELTNISQMISILHRVKPVPGRDLTEPITLLFKIATPSAPGQSQDDFSNASSFQLCLTERQLAQCTLDTQEKRRDALVACIMQLPYFRENGYDADGLFNYFLMDVKMGVKLQTTRMKQAISVARLYVQRCLLGLEVDNGVYSSHIPSKKWAWMQKHNV